MTNLRWMSLCSFLAVWLLQLMLHRPLLRGLSTVCFFLLLSQRWMVLDMLLFSKYEVSRGWPSVKQRCRKADIVTVQTHQPKVKTKPKNILSETLRHQLKPWWWSRGHFLERSQAKNLHAQGLFCAELTEVKRCSGGHFIFPVSNPVMAATLIPASVGKCRWKSLET